MRCVGVRLALTNDEAYDLTQGEAFGWISP